MSDMPGVIMDNASVGLPRQGQDAQELSNGLSSSPHRAEKNDRFGELRNGSIQVNGTSREVEGVNKTSTIRPESTAIRNPPELLHITHGFFPFAQLVNRSVQQCWNDLSDMITELADIQVPSQDQAASSLTGGKSQANQAPENVQKKLRILNFAHAKRAEFIKLLVLSQWSRQAADVSKLIDLQGVIRTRHQSYSTALQWLGDMKRDLVRAQVANPDLKTALEVLSKGKASAMPDFGYKPPRPLNAKKALKKLEKINRIISARLTLNDPIPHSFRTYRVHDARVTFFVPGEFELDLSIGEENMSSQFFFIDIRFTFSPSSPIPKGRILNELDIKVNEILQHSGLTGCFEFLHSLVLTNKINILFRQATELARGLWSDALRVELLHRTLVVQYWALRPGAKSWIEIGIRSGRREGDRQGVPYLSLRWMRDGKEVNNGDIQFDTENLSIESVLRSVIALHISHTLYSAYNKLKDGLLFSTRALSLRAQLSSIEPGECLLNVQLTTSRTLRISVEPMSGASVLSATPTALERPETERSSEKSAVDEIVARISRFRCIAAMEEIESNAKMLGFEIIDPRRLKLDVRRIFPPNILRFSFFSHRLWERSWIVAATSSIDGDNWWVVQLRTALPASNLSTSGLSVQSASIVQSAQVVSDSFLTAHQRPNYASFADLGHCLSGILAIHANARYLAELQSIGFYPPLQRLQIGSDLRVPDLSIRYEALKLPPALRTGLSPGSKKKAFIKETIRLAFHGIDSHEQAAIFVAHGQVRSPVKSLDTLVSKSDRTLVFQPKGEGFAIRLLAPAGQPVIVNLLGQLQRLECVISILEALQRRKIVPRSLSLSRITFAYSSEKDLSACIEIKTLSNPLEADPVDLRLRTEPLFQESLSIKFDHGNPHRRIQEALTAILNHSKVDAGLESVIELLSLTLPLLRALDTISANPSRNESLRVQITLRSAKSYLIRYPREKYLFLLRAQQHLCRLAWTLEDVSGPQDRTGQDHITSSLQEKLYNAKGDGWRGLGNGVVAEVERVGNMVIQLDSCFSNFQEGSEPKKFQYRSEK